MIIMGIDPGTRITGYGIIKERSGVISCIEYGAIKNPQKLSVWECQLKVFNGISKIISEYKIDAVAVESQFFSKNPDSTMKIGAARSVALLPASQSGIPISEYTPKRVKKAIVGTGTATKQQMQMMIQKILNIKEKIEPEDAADALGIAVCHLHNYQLSQMLK